MVVQINAVVVVGEIARMDKKYIILYSKNCDIINIGFKVYQID